ncbi:AAA family ATPase [Aurantimonas sp. MSK8Z-1]|uniref:AAA family ATPase n=1 Tax=Mangrovibrevibacter kandeliae TaxID=2968473 RepID=UPI0021189D9F|nr:AAA family ATPase [Aurantimonas sp. MSK8Z-1]MCW4114370.1 AAA family ATPase [Aurantimonas sp. MSK8Z-1]
MAQSKPKVRVVERRQVTADEITSETFDFLQLDDAGETVLVTESEVDPDSASAAQIRENRRVAFETKLSELKPSEFAVYLAITEAIRLDPAAVNKRLAGRSKNLVIAVRLPAESWYGAAIDAFLVVVAGIASKRLEVTFDVIPVTPEMDRNIGQEPLPIGAVLRAADRKHVIAVYDRAEQLPPALVPLADLHVDLTTLAPVHTVFAIARAFPDDPTVKWPPDLPVAELRPADFDAACSRATTAAEVLALIRQLAEISKRKAKADEKALAKSSSSSRKDSPVDILQPTEPLLENLHGYGAAKEWALQLFEDVTDYRIGDLPWSDVDAGCLLYGPPGTGKTLFAQSLAATTSLPLIATSYAVWQSAGTGHAGEVIKAMRATFETARKTAPCIVFIDEVDAIPARGGSGHNSDWWSMIVTALLECLDGISRREGVIVIAACNDPSLLDPALVRSGRLDRRFEIGLPNEDALLRIFAHHLPGADLDALAPAATALAGSTSGADVARIAREARRSARRQKRPVTAEDLLAIALPPDDRPPDLRRLIAVHEAGHAVVGMLCGKLPTCLSTVQAGISGGMMSFDMSAGVSRIGDIGQQVAMALAGRAAEEVILGQPSAGAGGVEGSDLQIATEILATADARQGLGGTLAFAAQADASAVEHRLRRIYAETVLMIVRHRRVVEALADLALERRVLGRTALQEFASAHGLGGR